MKLALTILGAAGLFFGGVALGLSHRDPGPARAGTAPKSEVLAPAPSPSPSPAGDAPSAASDEVEKLRKENSDLKAVLAEAQKAMETNNAKLIEDIKGAFPTAMTGTKLMDAKLKEKLGLTADQEAKMTQAITNYLKEQEELRKRQGMTPELLKSEQAQLKEQLESEFQGILSGSQYADLASARSEKKAKARESSVQGESSMWQGMLGLDEHQGRELSGIIKDYYATRPSDPVQGQWSSDPATRSRVQALLRTPEQQQRFEQMGQNGGPFGNVFKMMGDSKWIPEGMNKENK